MTVDDRLFAYLSTRLNGHGAIGTNACTITRDDWPDSLRLHPSRVEYNPFKYRGEDTYLGDFGLTIHFDRGDAYGAGNDPTIAGKIEAIELAVISRLAGQRPTGMTGFAVSTLQKLGRRQPTTSGGDDLTRRLDYAVSIIPGGTAVPLMGTDADLTWSGLPGRAVFWQFGPSVAISREGTEYADTATRYKAGNGEADGFVDIALTAVSAPSTPFPVAGSTVAVMFQTQNGTAWTDNVLIQRYQWLVPDGGDQRVRVFMLIESSDSAFFGGATV